MPWYAHTGPRYKHSSKFQSQLRPGTENTSGAEYRGWHYSFVVHQATGTTRRTRYGVTIRDPKKNRVAYLRDCSSIQQATDAAKHWIDSTLEKIAVRQEAGQVGTIPALPTRQFRANLAYEK